MSHTNQELFALSGQYIPGGVNSPVRSFNSVGGTPFFTAKANGCYLYDAENKSYIDYICSWGANIVGHANPYVVEQVARALNNGFSYGTPSELELHLAQQIINLVPSVEKIRLVSSGTEATMSAIRLARGYTGKRYIIKFNGCYHGHSDSLLVKAGSGLAAISQPGSNGVLANSVEFTLVLEYNCVTELEAAFAKYGDDIACVIMEPVAGNMNFVRPDAEFLATMRRLCDDYKAVLICDEVMTGFRVSLGGAQELLGIHPDLTTLGKVIGGGMPLAAFGGKAEIMNCLAPLGPVYQAGTLSGNPIAVTCGLATLELIRDKGFYTRLNNLSSRLVNGLADLAHKYSLPYCADYAGGMFGFYFSEKLPRDFNQVKQIDAEPFKRFFHSMLDAGVYFAPSMFEAGFLCSSHDEAVIGRTLESADKVLAKL